MRPLLNADRVTARLRAAGYADVRIVEQTGSTNVDMVKGAATALPEHFSVLLAEEQTAGKGRAGRAWSAPKSSQVIATVAVHLPGVRPASLGLVPLLAGNALARATGAQLKWPNDLLVDGRKLCGILVEAIQIEPFPVVAIGFGVNYDLTDAELPVPHATSYVAAGGQLSREDLIVKIMTELAEDVERFRAHGGMSSTVLPRYREHSCTLGTQVRALLPRGEVLEGLAEDIAEDGSLVIARTVDGALQRTTVSVGDVEHLR